MQESRKGTLYIVAVPIGNPEDITIRARQVLTQVTGVLCEDTRRSGRLFHTLGISAHLVSFHAHNQAQKGEIAIEKLQRGEDWALITDSGTPLVSDPGSLLVQRCHEAAIPVLPIPGVSAPVALYSVSGFVPQPVVFLGFLSPKKGRRRKSLEQWADRRVHIILFESPYRIQALLADIQEIFGDMTIFIGREMTKSFESYYRGSVSAFLSGEIQIVEKGEFAVMIEVIPEKSDKES